MSKKQNFEIENAEYKGSPVLTIWELDDEGNRKSFPAISFGKKKAKALSLFAEEITSFAGQEKEANEK